MTLDQKTLGAYYSPEPYAKELVRWALGGNSSKVLDPSFGGCAFLRVALDQLLGIGVEEPERLLYGTDVDVDATRWASQLVTRGVPSANLLNSDFLTLQPGRDLPQVGALVGNPPYVRHHRMDAKAMTAAEAAMRQAGVALNGRANLWAYFVIHATRFVKRGGRMALLLPGSILHADYARPVIDDLASKFSHVLLLRIGERVFADAQEETVVLLASGAGESAKNVRTMEIAGLEELSAFLINESPSTTPSAPYETDWKNAILDAECRELIEGIHQRSRAVTTLGSMAEIRIGTVTGANDFFLALPDEPVMREIGQHAVDVIPRSSWLSGPAFSSDELRTRGAAGGRIKLLTLPPDLDTSQHAILAARIDAAEARGVHRRAKCNRDPWWSLGTISVPDAFLPYMGSTARGVVINSARAACTNAIHQVRWRADATAEERSSAAVSSWSSITALSAELYGRNYGGGVLKLEPSAAKRVIVINQLPSNWSGLEHRTSRDLADRAVADTLNLTAREQAVIARNLGKLADRRSLRPR